MKLFHILFITCALFLPSGLLYGLDGWMTDLEQAKLQAVGQKKDLFIVYKGSFWNPEQYGTPESMFACDFVKKKLGRRFVLVLQEYPAEYKESPDLVSWKIEEDSVSFRFFERKKDLPTRWMFATSDHIPYHILSQRSSWIALQASATVAEKKKPVVLDLIRRVKETRGEQKFLLMGKLFNLANWQVGLPSALYPQMHREAVKHDNNNLSRVYDNNYVRTMKEMAWDCTLFLLNISALHAPNEELLEKMAAYSSPESIQQTQFLILSMKSFPQENEETGTLEEFIADQQKKTEQILALAPASETACQIRLQSKIVFPLFYYVNKLFPLASSPDKVLALLPGIMKQPWVDEETKQIFTIMEASSYLKKGELDKGLPLMQQAREVAPWTKNAVTTNSTIQSITEQLPALRELWRKKQAGDENAAKEYKKKTIISIDLSVVQNL